MAAERSTGVSLSIQSRKAAEHDSRECCAPCKRCRRSTGGRQCQHKSGEQPALQAAVAARSQVRGKCSAPSTCDAKHASVYAPLCSILSHGCCNVRKGERGCVSECVSCLTWTDDTHTCTGRGAWFETRWIYLVAMVCLGPAVVLAGEGGGCACV